MVGWNGLKEIVAVNGDAFEFQVYRKAPRWGGLGSCVSPVGFTHCKVGSRHYQEP